MQYTYCFYTNEIYFYFSSWNTQEIISVLKRWHIGWEKQKYMQNLSLVDWSMNQDHIDSKFFSLFIVHDRICCLLTECLSEEDQSILAVPCCYLLKVDPGCTPIVQLTPQDSTLWYYLVCKLIICFEIKTLNKTNFLIACRMI